MCIIDLFLENSLWTYKIYTGAQIFSAGLDECCVQNEHTYDQAADYHPQDKVLLHFLKPCAVVHVFETSTFTFLLTYFFI